MSQSDPQWPAQWGYPDGTLEIRKPWSAWAPGFYSPTGLLGRSPARRQVEPDAVITKAVGDVRRNPCFRARCGAAADTHPAWMRQIIPQQTWPNSWSTSC